MASLEDNLPPAVRASIKNMVAPSTPVSPRAANRQLDVDAFRLSVLKAEPVYGQKPNGNGKQQQTQENIEKLVLQIKIPDNARPQREESEVAYNTRLSGKLTEFLVGILKTEEGLEVAPHRQRTTIVTPRILTDATAKHWTLEVTLTGKALAAYIREIGLQPKKRENGAIR
jgi:hypothetical protein